MASRRLHGEGLGKETSFFGNLHMWRDFEDSRLQVNVSTGEKTAAPFENQDLQLLNPWPHNVDLVAEPTVQPRSKMGRAKLLGQTST